MNCPYCKVPLMGGMKICPKCKYDTSTSDGGPEHKRWLDSHDPAKVAQEEQAR